MILQVINISNVPGAPDIASAGVICRSSCAGVTSASCFRAFSKSRTTADIVNRRKGIVAIRLADCVRRIVESDCSDMRLDRSQERDEALSLSDVYAAQKPPMSAKRRSLQPRHIWYRWGELTINTAASGGGNDENSTRRTKSRMLMKAEIW